MSYTALYRKWRPQKFADVKGQEAIVRTLKNQIITGKIGHAYLFCGSRGTGKTTVAKIFAKAVNCENPQDGEPCGCCDTCRAIDAGNSLNVFELDAASNNGVDEVRDLIDQVQYPPTVGRKSVYILDEVHMMSKNAFNAFLKTLEEPPEHAIFVLATTEPHKLLPTILSRCQEYDFHRIGSETIIERLKELCAGEGIKISDHALEYIARKADGGLRDAISLLDRALASSSGELTYEDVLSSLGAASNETYSSLIRLIINKDAPGALAFVDEAIMNGREITQFTSDIIWYLRNILLVKTSTEDTPMVEVFEEDRKRLVEEARALSVEEILRDIRIFSEAYNKIRASVSKRVLFEVAVIKAMKPELDEDNASVLARIGSLEKQMSGEVRITAPVAPVQMPVAPVQTPVAPAPAPIPTPAPAVEPTFVQEENPFEMQPQMETQPQVETKPQTESQTQPDDITSNWEFIKSKIPAMRAHSLKNAVPAMEDGSLVVYLDSSYDQVEAKRDNITEKIKTIVKENFGKDLNVITKIGVADKAKTASNNEKAVREAFAGLEIEFEGED